MNQELQTLSQHLPRSIEFYHMGELKLAESVEELHRPDAAWEGRRAIAFTLRGELQAALVMILDSGLDESMYSEAGNIIASRMVTGLSDENGIDDVLSAPRLIGMPQLRTIMTLSSGAIRRKYSHFFQGREILLDLMLFVYAAEELPTEAQVRLIKPIRDLESDQGVIAKE